jgi:hypothetical protein
MTMPAYQAAAVAGRTRVVGAMDMALPAALVASLCGAAVGRAAAVALKARPIVLLLLDRCIGSLIALARRR